MNRAEFMRRLAELLGDVAPTEREEAIQYYNDYFDDAGTENESGVIASLGTPEELARIIKAGLNDGGSGGEFTESGFSGYAQMPKDEVIRPEDVNASKQSDETGSRGWSAGGHDDGVSGENSDSERYKDEGNDGLGRQGTQTGSGSGYYDGAYYRRPEGDSVYGNIQDRRKDNNPYGQSDNSSQNASYSQANGQNTSYGQYEYGTGSTYSQAKAGKEPMSGGMVVLIIIVAVLTSPVWLGLLGGLFGVAVGLVATLFALFLTFLIIGAVFVVVAIVLLVTGLGLLFSAPFSSLCLIGTALTLFALGLVAIWVMVALAGTAIPALVRGIGSLCQRIFHRGGARA